MFLLHGQQKHEASVTARTRAGWLKVAASRELLHRRLLLLKMKERIYLSAEDQQCCKAEVSNLYEFLTH